ncbi:hypothetical protein [Pseudoalteromonas sp.]|uniref:hypothetical protein n=1 Tax=Pseudoalteromonas sp. TaxID=53249 RepID=UPI003D0ECCA5
MSDLFASINSEDEIYDLAEIDSDVVIGNLLGDIKKLQEENAELKKQSQWVSVDVEPPTPHEHTEWDKSGDNCTFDGWISNTFELSDGSPYNFARGHYQDDGNWVVYGAEHDFQIVEPSKVKFYKPLPTQPEVE